MAIDPRLLKPQNPLAPNTEVEVPQPQYWNSGQIVGGQYRLGAVQGSKPKVSKEEKQWRDLMQAAEFAQTTYSTYDKVTRQLDNSHDTDIFDNINKFESNMTKSQLAGDTTFTLPNGNIINPQNAVERDRAYEELILNLEPMRTKAGAADVVRLQRGAVVRSSGSVDNAIKQLDIKRNAIKQQMLLDDPYLQADPIAFAQAIENNSEIQSINTSQAALYNVAGDNSFVAEQSKQKQVEDNLKAEQAGFTYMNSLASDNLEKQTHELTTFDDFDDIMAGNLLYEKADQSMPAANLAMKWIEGVGGLPQTTQENMGLRTNTEGVPYIEANSVLDNLVENPSERNMTNFFMASLEGMVLQQIENSGNYDDWSPEHREQLAHDQAKRMLMDPRVKGNIRDQSKSLNNMMKAHRVSQIAAGFAVNITEFQKDPENTKLFPQWTQHMWPEILSNARGEDRLAAYARSAAGYSLNTIANHNMTNGAVLDPLTESYASIYGELDKPIYPEQMKSIVNLTGMTEQDLVNKGYYQRSTNLDYYNSTGYRQPQNTNEESYTVYASG